MRLFLGIVGIGFGFAATCSSLTIDQCASDCGCQRVACCCGAGCDKTNGVVQYNACVPANSPYDQWTGCPSASACAAYSGLVRTITPCVVSTSAPTTATQSTDNLAIPFGTTFPMIGTQELEKQTWQKNVYMGTSMQFNKGAFWGYTDSYSVPSWNNNVDAPGVDNNGNPIPTPAPTPVDATGRPCFSYSQPCPSGYYCQLNTGYNVQQKGTCQREAANTWTGGAGKFTDSQYYTGLAHPPLVLDPNHNGVASSGYGPNYGSSGYGYPGYGTGYGSTAPYGTGGVESCAPLPTGAPVCGFKSYTGTCFCDGDCAKTGDCCTDYAQHCGVLSNQYTGGPLTPATTGVPAYSSPATGSSAGAGTCDPVGQCAGLCGSSNSAVGVNGKPCFCDSQCALSGDCCCSISQCASG